MKDVGEIVRDKRVLFITTKNIDYIRNVQEISILKEYAGDCLMLFSTRKWYVVRILEVWVKLFKCSLDDIDVVFVGFAPQLVLPLYHLKTKQKIVVIDFFISVYDTLVKDRRIFKDGGAVAKLCHWIDYVTLKRANYVITDTKADTEYFVKEFAGDVDKFETWYLEADSSIYYPRKQNKRVDLLNKFVVLYFGSILPLQGVDVILEAISLLKEEKVFFFQIIGPIPEKYNKPIQENLEYIEWLEQEQLAEYIANADLCLAGHFNNEIDKAKRTIPGKAFIYELMGKRMILGDNIANHELFIEDDNHKFVEMGNARRLSQLIMER